jgi:hypothetical protein
MIRTGRREGYFVGEPTMPERPNGRAPSPSEMAGVSVGAVLLCPPDRATGVYSLQGAGRGAADK